MSSHSTAARRSLSRSISSASRSRYGSLPCGPSAAHSGKAAAAAATAAAASSSPPAETWARTRPSIGLRSSKRSAEATRSPPMKWSVDTLDAGDLGEVGVSGLRAQSSVRVSRSSTE